MLVMLLVKACGGTWGLKQRCCRARNLLMRRFYWLLWHGWMTQNGSSIEHTTVFGSQPCFPHGIKGVFISGDARIGRNCVIFQQVTIGSNYLLGSKRMGAPTIGDNCLIGAGARIIGGIKVGDNCRIGAGCVVFEDVPDNSVVVFAAPRVIQRTEPVTNRYYSRKNEVWHYFEDGTWVQEKDAALLTVLEEARNPRCGNGTD